MDHPTGVCSTVAGLVTMVDWAMQKHSKYREFGVIPSTPHDGPVLGSEFDSPQGMCLRTLTLQSRHQGEDVEGWQGST